ncbi:MAG: Hsp70 family protein [Terracidiphilus sp.]|nr:Hsp70 family protein [Terracidiphilus sp.]
MRLGIDFGTTRVVVALVDRGNFPLVSFEAPDGQTHDWFPPVAAVNGEQRVYGWEAIAAQEDENWTVLRSLKRYLRSANPHTLVPVAGQQIPLRQLMVEMMLSLKAQLLHHSNVGVDLPESEEKFDVMLGVPANANSNQRFLTEEAAQAAGFNVLGLLNEPSAAAIEFAHRNSSERKSRAGSGLVVYDLGGGTFDVSLVTLGETEHTVEASDGIPNLGGDDFDEILASLVLESLGEGVRLKPSERYRLLEECREKKETLNPNTRKVTLDLERVRAGWEQVTIPVDDYYERCRPLIEQTRAVVDGLLAKHADRQLDTLYVTGGAAELPPVARILRESFGRKVRRSAYMRSASAIGLAIRAAVLTGDMPGQLPEAVQDQFNRNFGMWRETNFGGTIFFDLIFPRGVQLPDSDELPLRIERIYRPAHNIGHFRYLECSQLDEQGQPKGEIANWDQILFPFDPSLQHHPDLASVPVELMANAADLRIREEYTCDFTGTVRVKIHAEPAGYSREYTIAQSA